VKIAIAQPTYLPWLGYFDLIDQVDCFVILDSVQFEKQSWQQRNRIKTPSGLQWLTVPVVFRGRLGQRIRDVEIRSSEFIPDHLRAIELNYRRAPFFDAYFQHLTEILQAKGKAGGALADLNMSLIQWFIDLLGIKKEVVRSSDLNEPGKRCELLVNLCRRLNADSYLSPLGSAGYLLEELDRFSACGIRVEFQNYAHPEYRQLFPPFCGYASALDLLFNEGGCAREIVNSGRRPALAPHQVASALPAEEVRQ
jgi:hypothetical protein